MATKAVQKNTEKNELGAALSAQSRAGVLLAPRITEKASERAMNANVYVFNVDPRTTKFQIKKAVIELYKVAIVTVPVKQVFVRGKYGQSKGGKKAYIYLKKGDTIEFV